MTCACALSIINILFIEVTWLHTLRRHSNLFHGHLHLLRLLVLLEDSLAAYNLVGDLHRMDSISVKLESLILEQFFALIVSGCHNLLDVVGFVSKFFEGVYLLLLNLLVVSS